MPIPRITVASVVALSLLFVGWPQTSTAQGPMDRGLAIEALKHTDYGLRFLRDRQAGDGSWSGSVHVTALALHAFLRSYQGYNEADGAFITRPVGYLLNHARDDGSIGHDPAHRVRDTAAAVLALHATGNPDYAPIVARAQAYLTGMQLDEDDGVGRDDPRYGGIADGVAAAPDVLTLYQALAALHDTGLAPVHPVWARARVFLERSQDAGSGAFASSPAAATAQGADPDPLPTRAGFAALLYAGADRDDPHVSAAWRWIGSRGGAGETAPGDRPFLFYDTAVAGMLGYGQPLVTGLDGAERNWRDDLTGALLDRYDPNGSWGDDPDTADLSTALAVRTLNRVLHSLR
jgi:squalene-hopene/tetraprenyl-beta-curcumene cyclase